MVVNCTVNGQHIRQSGFSRACEADAACLQLAGARREQTCDGDPISTSSADACLNRRGASGAPAHGARQPSTPGGLLSRIRGVAVDDRVRRCRTRHNRRHSRRSRIDAHLSRATYRSRKHGGERDSHRAAGCPKGHPPRPRAKRTRSRVGAASATGAAFRAGGADSRARHRARRPHRLLLSLRTLVRHARHRGGGAARRARRPRAGKRAGD